MTGAAAAADLTLLCEHRHACVVQAAVKCSKQEVLEWFQKPSCGNGDPDLDTAYPKKGMLKA